MSGPQQIDTEELRDQVAVGVHTGLRKGTDAKGSHKAWVAIGADESGWGDAVDWFISCMAVQYPKGFTWVPGKDD